MIGIIIVNYKSINQTVDYIQKELCKIEGPYKVVVVNIACDDRTNISLTDKLSACFVPDVNSEIDLGAHVFILPHPENLGYARGNNLGAEFFRKHFSPEYLLVTNNDLELKGDVTYTLIKTLKEYKDVGAIGPRILGLDGRNQSPHRYISYTHFVLSSLFYPFYALLKKLHFVKSEIIFNAQEGYCDRLMGSFFIMPARAFHTVGGFDPNTFLYAEELILSERLASNGLRCYFQPKVTVIHYHGKTTSKSFSERKALKLRFESLLYYYQHYRGVSSPGVMLGRFAKLLYLSFYFPLFHVVKKLFGK